MAEYRNVVDKHSQTGQESTIYFDVMDAALGRFGFVYTSTWNHSGPVWTTYLR